MTTTTTETEPFEYGDPRIGSLTDTYTWQAIPAPKIDDGDPLDRLGGYCVVAGDGDEADVWIEVTAEYPQAVAEFIVEAVQNEYERQTGFQRAKDTTIPRRPAEDLKAAAEVLLSAAEFLDGAVGTPPSGFPITRVLEHARAINMAVKR